MIGKTMENIAKKEKGKKIGASIFIYSRREGLNSYQF